MRTYISLQAAKEWISSLGYAKWNLYEIGEGRESAIMEHKGDTMDESLQRLDSVVSGTSTYNKETKYRIVVFKNDNPNSLKYEKYFSLNGGTDSPKDTTQPLFGLSGTGMSPDLLTLFTSIGELKGQSQAKEAFIGYREEQLIRRETLMEVKEKELEEKFKQREKELKSEIEGLKKRYEDNVGAAKDGFSMALIEGVKAFTGMQMGGNGNKAIGGIENEAMSDTLKRVLALAKEKGWNDTQWQDVGNIVASVPNSFHEYFLLLCAVYKVAGEDKEKVKFLATQIPQIAIP